jgi:hypothetical protein
MSPWPEKLVALLVLAPGVTAPPRWSEADFNKLSKSQRQRWIRRLKGFWAHLRGCLPP